MTASVVQGKNLVSEGVDVQLVLDGAPASGNFLIAMVSASQTSAFNPVTVQSGWALSTPYEGSGASPVWSSGPWGFGAVYYKSCGGSESTTQKPVVLTGSTPFAITIFEVTNLGGTWLEAYRPQGNPGDIYEETMGRNLAATLYPYGSDVTLWQTPSTQTVLLLSHLLFTDNIAPTVTGYDHSISSSTATTVGGWGLAATRHTARLNAYYHDIPVSTNNQAVITKTGITYGSLLYVGLISNLSGGGGGGEAVTTSTIVPAVSQSVFKYTTIT